MPAKGSFALYLYDLVSGAIGEYSSNVEMLRLTNVSPGGYGQFEAKIKVSDANLLRPELALGARIALMDPSVPEPHHSRFIGEVNAPEYILNEVDGEYVHIVGEGIGSTLRDDPANSNYNNADAGRSPQFILKDQMTLNTGQGGTRASYLPIDQDTSQILPDNPALTFAPSYTWTTQEDVIQDIATKCGDYSWGVWAHPTNRDAAGFPTGQLVVHARDKNTVTYTALMSDIQTLTFRPDYSRCINVIAIGYNDPTQATPVSAAGYVSPLLNANGTQGSAPFRRRAYAANFAGTNTINKATAQSIANTYGALWSARVSFTTEIVLRNVRDANGNPIPLWQCQADANIAIPDLSRRILAFARINQLPTTLTAGVNVFYIRQSEYYEDAAGSRGGAQQLSLQLDNFVDTAETKITRLQAYADWQQQIADTTTAATQAAGAPWYGQAGGKHQASGAAQPVGQVCNYGVTLSNTPTSIIVDSTITSTNVQAASQNVSNMTTSGFEFFWLSNASGTTELVCKVHTRGNTVFEIDAQAGTFAHHCQACERRLREQHGCPQNAGCAVCYEGATRHGLSIWHDARYTPALDHEMTPDGGRFTASHEPGRTAFAVYCPCGSSEHMATQLRPEDANPLLRPFEHEHAAAWRALYAARGHVLSEAWHHGVRESRRPHFAPAEETAEESAATVRA